MKPKALQIVLIGLSITSSWGNGHATTYRALAKALAARGHKVLFLERNAPWYAENRDLDHLAGCQIEIYENLDELKDRFTAALRAADLAMVGSYTPEGIAVGKWVIASDPGVAAFYDIDTPVTLSRLNRGKLDYLNGELISRYQLYLSFTGGPTLERLQKKYRSQLVRPFYCSVDTELYFCEKREIKWDLGYLGTYSRDRQGALKRLMLEPAGQWKTGRFIVAGSQYPSNHRWPSNVDRAEHLAPCLHRAFYNQQRFTLNITRRDMIEAGYSPSVRLFEAAACATPIISDSWPGTGVFFRTEQGNIGGWHQKGFAQISLGLAGNRPSGAGVGCPSSRAQMPYGSPPCR